MRTLDQKICNLFNPCLEGGSGFSQTSSWNNGPFQTYIAIATERVKRYEELYSKPLTQMVLMQEILLPLTSKLLIILNKSLEAKKQHWLYEIIPALMLLSDQLASLPPSIYPVKLIEKQFLISLDKFFVGQYSMEVAEAMIHLASKISSEEKSKVINRIKNELFWDEFGMLKEKNALNLDAFLKYCDEDYTDRLLNTVSELVKTKKAEMALDILEVISLNKYTEQQLGKILEYLSVLKATTNSSFLLDTLYSIYTNLGKHFKGEIIPLILPNLLHGLESKEPYLLNTLCTVIGGIAFKLDKEQAEITPPLSLLARYYMSL
ncbi:MAG: hypothetical protein WC627_12170 [Legionella sp.]